MAVVQHKFGACPLSRFSHIIGSCLQEHGIADLNLFFIHHDTGNKIKFRYEFNNPLILGPI